MKPRRKPCDATVVSSTAWAGSHCLRRLRWEIVKCRRSMSPTIIFPHRNDAQLHTSEGRCAHLRGRQSECTGVAAGARASISAVMADLIIREVIDVDMLALRAERSALINLGRWVWQLCKVAIDGTGTCGIITSGTAGCPIRLGDPETPANRIVCLGADRHLRLVIGVDSRSTVLQRLHIRVFRTACSKL